MSFQSFAIFGPPGTGKTTEMLRLVGDAKDRGFGTHEIGFFSFTKAAASEALRRLGLTRSDKISTLHSLAFRAMGASPMQMVDSYKLKKFGHKAGIAFSGQTSDEYGDQMEVGDKYLMIYNLARSKLTSPRDEYYENDERPGDFAQFEHCIASYNSWKQAYGYIDFTDMIEQYCRSPVDHGAAVLFIDEAQDLSALQWAMIQKMLAFDRVREVTIAGDDDQAIYEWSGADPHGMVRFAEKQDAQTSVLAQSYRVPKAMHDVARSIAQTIENRVKKSYRAAQHAGAVERSGAGFRAESIDHGDDVLILCRSHAQKKEVEDGLIAIRKPYRVEGGRPGLFDSIWADGIRAYRKAASGGRLTEAEREKLMKVGTSDTKRILGSVSWMFATEWEKLTERRAIAIPSQFVEFFRDADLDQTPTIRVSTIHAAKGKEARRVVLHTGITQRTEKGIDKNPDAEARVWYVGVTRAIQQLDIVGGFDLNYTIP